MARKEQRNFDAALKFNTDGLKKTLTDIFQLYNVPCTQLKGPASTMRNIPDSHHFYYRYYFYGTGLSGVR
jgi:hypothetical protein